MTDTPRPPGSARPPYLDRFAPGLPVEADLTADHLPCGRATDPLIELATSGRDLDEVALDDHQRSCVHCRALLTETTRLWAPVHDLAARQESPPDALLEAIMDTVRALGREPLHLVIAGTRGTTRITATALARIAEQAAAAVPGIRLVLARGSQAHVDPTATSSRPVGVAGQHTVIQLAVVATYGQSLPDTAARVRSVVADRLRAMASTGTTTVDIYIDDVLPPARP